VRQKYCWHPKLSLPKQSSIIPSNPTLQSLVKLKSYTPVPEPISIPQPIPCMTFNQFPPTEPYHDDQQHLSFRSFITQTTIDHTGRRVSLSPTDEVLNW
jgi:hypothetical protein